MQPWEHTRASRLAGPLGLTALTIALAAGLSSIGLTPDTPNYLGPVTVFGMLLAPAAIALAYVLGAFGLGRPLAAAMARGSEHRVWHQLALGLAAMLWVSHMLGMVGLLSGPGSLPRLAGWSVPVLGLLLLGDQIVRGPLRPERWPVLPASAMLWAPGIALLVVAASSPAGALWRSEFGAFDALSYHLQLPKEWSAGPNLWPTPHNVYSYLPSFMEAAFLHLAAMSPGGSDPIARTVGGEGNWVIACQFLHAMIAIVAAILTARASWILVRRCGAIDHAARVLAVAAGAFTLCTPWVIVTGSLPYNEAGLIALGAAGVLAAIDPALSPSARGVAAGLAVGVACGCKPTALFMVGPLVGLLLLGETPIRRWTAPIASGCVAGIVAIAPWLIRNALASGNPVFPFAAGIFGRGEWTAEQIARHARSHHAPPGVGLGERVSRLFSGQYGLMHPQWGIALGVLALGMLVAVAWPRSRRFGALIVAGVAMQVACWMLLTHLQSRFLIALITPASLLLAILGAALVAWLGRASPPRRAVVVGGLAVVSLAPLAQALRSATTFLEENGGRPNALLVIGVGSLTGVAVDDQLHRASDQARDEFLARTGPVQFVNLRIRPQETPDAGVYLFGDSTPLYFLGALGEDVARPGSPYSPVIYHTTWDTPLLGPPAARTPQAPRWIDWSNNLRARGVRYVLFNDDELARLIARDQYYDPGVTLQDIAAWRNSPEGHLRIIRRWRDAGMPAGSGSELYEIDLPAPARR